MKYTVRLNDNTIGTIDDNTIDGQHADAFIGELVNVHLHDENGNEIEKEGRLVEILEETGYRLTCEDCNSTNNSVQWGAINGVDYCLCDDCRKK
jgi:hypothetical protein